MLDVIFLGFAVAFGVLGALMLWVEVIFVSPHIASGICLGLILLCAAGAYYF